MTMISKQRNWVLGITSIGLAVSILGVTGCTSMKRTAQGNPDRTAGQLKDDKKVRAEIEKALINNPVYKYPSVEVSVYRGEVALSGFVITEHQRQEAVRVARGIQGVSEVNDKLVIARSPGIPVIGQTTPMPGESEPRNEPPK